MKKILTIIGALSLTTISTMTVIACGAQTHALLWLDNIIKVTDLGEFDHEPSNDEILTHLKVLNPKLNINEVEIINSENGNTTVRAKNDSQVYYYKSVELTYKVNDTRSLLSDDITVTEIENKGLGNGNGDSWNKEFLDRIKEVNPKFKYTIEDYMFYKITDSGEWNPVINFKRTIEVNEGNRFYKPSKVIITIELI